MNSMHQTALSITSQNYGARKFDRIKKVFFICIATVTCVGLVLGNIAYLLSPVLLKIYSPLDEVIKYGTTRLMFICVPYFLCGLMDTIVGAARGLGCSIQPTIISLLGSCLLRVVWIYTVFQVKKELWVLYISYPITWIITAAIQLILYFVVFEKRKKQMSTPGAEKVLI